jgi:hypothetical protein
MDPSQAVESMTQIADWKKQKKARNVRRREIRSTALANFFVGTKKEEKIGRLRSE